MEQALERYVPARSLGDIRAGGDGAGQLIEVSVAYRVCADCLLPQAFEQRAWIEEVRLFLVANGHLYTPAAEHAHLQIKGQLQQLYVRLP